MRHIIEDSQKKKRNRTWPNGDYSSPRAQQLAVEFFNPKPGAYVEWPRADPGCYIRPIVFWDVPKHSIRCAETGWNAKTALELTDKGSPSRQTKTTDIPPTLSELLHYSLLFKSIRQIAQEEVRSMYAFEIDRSLIKTAKDVLSYGL